MLPEPFYKDELTTIYCGDAEQLLKLIGKVDAIVTDPPYGISAAKKGTVGSGKNTAFGNRAKSLAYITHFAPKDWDAKTPPPSMFEAIMQHSKHQIIFGGNYFGLPGTSCYLIWDKENGTTDFADCELAWTNLKKAVRKLTYRWQGLLQEDQGNKEIRRHPTQKPVAVMEWCIKQLPPVTLILDPYMGSGTTLLAARRLGIRSIGIDLDPEYCEIAKKTITGELQRWQKPKLTIPDSMAIEQLPLFKKGELTMGKKTPEGIAKDAILEANGGFPPEVLALFVNFTGYVQYEDAQGNKRGYKAGLTTSGSSDLIAAYSLVITPEMVGKTVLALGVLEVKRADQPPKPTPGQVSFIDKVIARGGFGGVVRTVQEVKTVICEWLKRLKSQ